MLYVAPLLMSGRKAPTRWTFAVSSTYGEYSGHLGTQAVGTGAGLADGDRLSDSSIWGSGSGTDQYIAADFGQPVWVSRVIAYPILSSHRDVWGPSYLNGRDLQTSIDGTGWTTVQTIANVTDSDPLSIDWTAAPRELRYVRIFRASSGYIGVGDFYFL